MSRAPWSTAASTPGAYINGTNYNRAPVNPGLYDGPYMITAYDSGNQIVMEPNPHWNGTKPGFKRIVLRHIENTAALQANLLSGDVDMVAGEGVGLTIDQVLALQKAHPDQFHYDYKPSLNYEHIDLKKENPLPAGRARAPRAADGDRTARPWWTGCSRASSRSPPPGSTRSAPTTTSRPSRVVKFDPAGAKALLKEAGWTPGSDGMCRNAAGDRLEFELGTTAGNRLRELQEQVVQSNCKNACVAITSRTSRPAPCSATR